MENFKCDLRRATSSHSLLLYVAPKLHTFKVRYFGIALFRTRKFFGNRIVQNLQYLNIFKSQKSLTGQLGVMLRGTF